MRVLHLAFAALIACLLLTIPRVQAQTPPPPSALTPGVAPCTVPTPDPAVASWPAPAANTLHIQSSTFSPGGIATDLAADNTVADASPIRQIMHCAPYDAFGRLGGYYEDGGVQPVGAPYLSYLYYLASVYPSTEAAVRAWNEASTSPMGYQTHVIHPCGTGVTRCTSVTIQEPSANAVYNTTPTVPGAFVDARPFDRYVVEQYRQCTIEVMVRMGAQVYNSADLLATLDNTIAVMANAGVTAMTGACSAPDLATPTPTAPPTLPATSTPTAAPTLTSTPLATPSLPSPVPTPTATATSTPTATATSTPSATATSMPGPTATSTPVPTVPPTPSLVIKKVEILLSVKGTWKDTRRVPLGRTALFVVQYAGHNLDGRTPVGTLSITRAGKLLDTFFLTSAVRGGNPALGRSILIADRHYKGHLYAHFLLSVGGISVKRDRKFSVK